MAHCTHAVASGRVVVARTKHEERRTKNQERSTKDHAPLPVRGSFQRVDVELSHLEHGFQRAVCAAFVWI